MSTEPAAAPAPAAARSRRRLAAAILPGALLGLWLAATPAGLLGKADAVAYAVCHRIELRSFALGERALPLCARCSGMYLGTLLAAAYFMARRRGRATEFPSLPLLGALAALAAAFAVDGANSYLSFFTGQGLLYPPSNTGRLITGTGLGLGLGTLVYAGFNQVAWRTGRALPALRSGGDLAALLALAGLMILALHSGNPLILYPLALLSSLTVLGLLTIVYTTLTLVVLRRDNQADRWGQLAAPLTAGLTLALLQVAALDLGRYLLTGTWGGFAL